MKEERNEISERLKEIKVRLKHIKIKTPRIKVIKAFHFFLAAVLFIRIAYIHHVYADQYVAYITKKEEQFIFKKSKTRGSIYDRNNEELVVNIPTTSIIYRFHPQIGIQEMVGVANLLAELIDVDTKKLTSWDLSDIYRKENDLTDDIEVTKQQQATVSEQSRQAYVIFKKMSEAFYGGENTIKFAASDEEVARVSEKIDQLRGVDIAFLAKREYPSILGKHAILGHLSREGSLPADNFWHYIAAGYTMNDRVGMSCIEYQYEDWLRGYKSVHTHDEDGNVITLFDGQPGVNLTLTIDANFSKQIDEILEKSMISAKAHRAGAQYLKEGYVAAVNPKNGEILSLNGIILDEKKDKVFSHPLGTLHSSFTMGSVVKGATLLTGYAHNIVDYGDMIHDKPLIFADGSKKGSWSPLGTIDDIDALRLSSNVYFLLQAIKFGGDVYEPKKDLNIDLSIINDYRLSFAQFGLGAYTGIDLPGEQTGMRNPERSIAKLLDLVIGQSDTYTTLQLAQYASTIANGGQRYAFQLLKEASIPVDEENSILVHTFHPRLLNTIDLPEVAFERIQEGFRQALQVQGGTGNLVFSGAKYNPAGKTGTAEEFARDADGKLIVVDQDQLIPVHHTTFVGYAPADDPEIAIAVVFPQSELPKHKNLLALEVADDVFKAYFSLNK